MLDRGRNFDKVVCIVHYNTPELTRAAIWSIRKHGGKDYRIVVFDNSDKRPFAPVGEPLQIEDSNVWVYDNTRGQLIDFDAWLDTFDSKERIDNNYASARHCYTVQWLVDNLRCPFVLMDSDVLVKRDFSDFFDDECVWVGMSSLHYSRFGNVMRVEPMICYVNAPMMLAHDVTYFSAKKMYALTHRRPDGAYDTGCWFYEDCNLKKLQTRHVDTSDYIVHFGHGSWGNKGEQEAQKWLKNHRNLWRND